MGGGAPGAWGGEPHAARRARRTQGAQTLAAKTQLRAGLTAAQAAEIMWAYSSPELYGLLVLGRRWSPARYGEFVGQALVDALLPERGFTPRVSEPCQS